MFWFLSCRTVLPTVANVAVVVYIHFYFFPCQLLFRARVGRNQQRKRMCKDLQTLLSFVTLLLILWHQCISHINSYSVSWCGWCARVKRFNNDENKIQIDLWFLDFSRCVYFHEIFFCSGQKYVTMGRPPARKNHFAPFLTTTNASEAVW